MKLFQKGELKLLWPFYLEHFVAYTISLLYIFLLVYFIDIGFSLTQIGFLLAVVPLTMLLFEIPTGAIADLYGRKFSVLLGYFLEAGLIFSLMFSTSYYYILSVLALLGIAMTLSSGSKEAWVVDLINHKKGNFVNDFFIKEHSILGVALIISGIVGAFFVKQFGVSIIFPISGFSLLVSIVILSFAQEHHVKRKIKIKQSIKELSKQTKISISYIKNHPVLFYLLLGGMFFTLGEVFTQGLSWIPLLQELNFQDHWFGYMWSGMWAITAIAPLFSKKLVKKTGELNFIIWTTSIGMVILLLIYFAINWIMVLVIMFSAAFLYEIHIPASRSYFHKFTPRKLRATIGSVESMLFALVGIIALPLAGYLVDVIGPRYVIMLSSIVAIPGIMVYMKIKEDRIQNT